MAEETTKKGVSWADQMDVELEEERRPASPATATSVGVKGSSGSGGMRELLAVIKKLQTEMVALKKRTGTEGNSDVKDFNKPQEERNTRAPDGRPICHFCGEVGHIRRFCEKKRKSHGKDGTGTAVEMVRPSPAETGVAGDIPLLLIDTDQLVTEEVLVQGKRVEAVIDTGAAVSVMAPGTVVELGLAIHAGGAPSVVMVNGQRAPPLSSVIFTIEIAGKTVETKAIVLDMKGNRLLLGNDTLKKFKRLEIQYGEGRPKLWQGELPVGLLAEGEQEGDGEAADKVISREGRNLPPRSLVAVEIEPISSVLACSVLIEPSTSLEKAKGISAGRVLVNEQLVRVLMLNPGNRTQYIRSGTVIGNAGKIEEETTRVRKKRKTGTSRAGLTKN